MAVVDNTSNDTIQTAVTESYRAMKPSPRTPFCYASLFSIAGLGNCFCLRMWALICILPALLFLVPFWTFRFVPTVNGPAHLANSVILREYGHSTNRFQEFYWIDWQPLPNSTCFAFLACLSAVMPALVAEKLLLTLYLIGFALGYRYFLGSAGHISVLPVWAGFLLVINGCFWNGNYNYCLSIVLYFVILGYLLRRWKDLRFHHVLVLCLLFGLVFFTHLVGFLLAACSCIWIGLTVPPRRWGKFFALLAVLTPFVALAIFFFDHADFHRTSSFSLLGQHLLSWVEGEERWTAILDDLGSVNEFVFGINFESRAIIGTAVLILYEAFVVFGILELTKPKKPEHIAISAAPIANQEAEQLQGTKPLSQGVAISSPGSPAFRHSLAGLGFAIAMLYFVLPDSLLPGSGGQWKMRLVLLPPLLWLACLPVHTGWFIRRALAVGTLGVLALDLSLITSHVQRANQALSEFTAGIDAAGRNHALFFNTADLAPGSLKPLLVLAGNYYCLESNNINLCQHFATRLHSLVRLRPGLAEGQGDFNKYQNRSLVDLIVSWDEFNANPEVPSGFEIVFRKGRLTVLRRFEGKDPVP